MMENFQMNQKLKMIFRWEMELLMLINLIWALIVQKKKKSNKRKNLKYTKRPS